MRERDNSQYEKLSPQELNAHLRQVYAQIPKYKNFELKQESGIFSVYFGEEKLSERSARRQSSEHKKRLSQIHSDLIDLSHLSTFFKELEKNTFSTEYDLGFSLDMPELPAPHLVFSSRDLLDLENPESAGIYDPKIAKEIEQKAYKAQLSKDMHYNESFLRRGKQINPAQLKIEGKMRGEWLIQFLEKHGELP